MLHTGSQDHTSACRAQSIGRKSGGKISKIQVQIICKLFASKISHKQILANNYLVKFANIWSTGIFYKSMRLLRCYLALCCWLLLGSLLLTLLLGSLCCWRLLLLSSLLLCCWRPATWLSAAGGCYLQGCKGWHFQNLVFLAFIGLNHAKLLETGFYGLFLFHFPPKSANFRLNSPFSFFFPLNSANFPEIFRFPFPSLSKSANFRRNFIFWFSLI